MGQRTADGTIIDPCLEKVKPGEPFFVLRGQDTSAAELVEDWAMRNVNTLAPAKYNEALQHARRMRAYAMEFGKAPD